MLSTSLSFPRAAVAVAVCVFLSGCGQSEAYRQHDKHAEAVMECLEDYADDLESVKDKESAKEAAARIVRINDRLRRLVDDQPNLLKLNDADKEKINQQYNDRYAEVRKRIGEAGPQAINLSEKEPNFLAAYQKLRTYVTKAKF